VVGGGADHHTRGACAPQTAAVPSLGEDLGGRFDNSEGVIHICLTMKTATVRDLRNRFSRVAAWIAEGEPVEITKNGKPFARLSPAAPEKRRRFKMPDIMARLQQDFGDTKYDAKDLARGLAASRGDLS
jgi:prevent-host-death family protein